MHSIRSVLACGMAIAVTACATHPQPEDVLRPDATLDIVQRIRCEAHDAIKDIDRKYPGKFGADFSIAFRFTLTAAEENNNSLTNTGFKDPIAKGTVAVGLAGKHTRHRTTERKFIFTDTFAVLRDLDMCGAATPEHWAYPISGSIGLQEVVATYAELYRPPPRSSLRAAESSTATKCEPLPKKDDGSTACCCCCKEPPKPKPLPALPKNFHDVLKFTAQYYGSVKPTILLTPITKSFHFAGGTDTLDADRTDIHQVDVALAPTEPDARETLRFDLLTEQRILPTLELLQ